MKDFFELREAKVSAQFADHTPDKDFNDLAKKHKVKVTHDKSDEKTTIHGDENAVLSVLKTMYGNDWKDMYTKKGSTYVDESVKTEDKGQFIYAAKQAKAKGDSTFVFAGKTYNCEEVLENEDLDEAVNMGPWNRGAINKAMAEAGIKGPMAKAFIAALRGMKKESVDLEERKLDVRNVDDQELFKKAVAIAMDKFPKDRNRAEREIAKLDRGQELLRHQVVQTALKRAPYQ